MEKSQCYNDSTLALPCSHLAKKSVVIIIEYICEHHGSGKLDVVDWVFNICEGFLNLSSILRDNLFMRNVKIVELSQIRLCLEEILLIIELNFTFFLFGYCEPFMQRDTLVVIHNISVADVLSNDDTNDVSEFLQ